MKAPKPENEAVRLASLREYAVLDTLPEQAYDDITYLASSICGTPIALISLVDEDRQWFKSRVGLKAEQTPRDVAFCAHAILESTSLFVVPDASQDRRFANNPLVTEEPCIRFYAGAPLVTSRGEALGALCVIDRVPRQLDPEKEKALRALSRQVMVQLELRLLFRELARRAAELQRYHERLDQSQRELEKINAFLEIESSTDGLTRLENRASFDRQLKTEFRRAERYRTPISLLLVDVDEFKTYNDTFGHPAGDEIIRGVAKLLRQCARTHDIIGRYGGDEFALILPNTDRAGATAIAERILRAIQVTAWPNRAMTASLGVASLSASTQSGLGLVTEADKALYEAKRAGRNRICESPPSPSA